MLRVAYISSTKSDRAGRSYPSRPSPKGGRRDGKGKGRRKGSCLAGEKCWENEGVPDFFSKLMLLVDFQFHSIFQRRLSGESTNIFRRLHTPRHDQEMSSGQWLRSSPIG